MPRTKPQTEKKTKGSKVTPKSKLVPSGSTLLNLALSDNPFGGYLRGTMVNTVGDSSSGKTFLAMSTFAEMGLMRSLDPYEPVFDDAEHANAFDMPHLFGKKIASRIQPPAIDKEGLPVHSNTIEDFHFHVTQHLKKGPCIYVTDSMDALTCEEEQDKAEEIMKAREKGKDVSGSYGTAKAKANSQILRLIVGDLEKTDSFLNIISQTRDRIGASFMQSKKIRSGGHALEFYGTHVLWLAKLGKITVTRKDHKYTIGVNCRVRVSKNKLTGKVREVEFPIYYDYGVDDIGSCTDWMVEHGVWVKKGKVIDAGDFGEGSRKDIIRNIEDNDLEKDMKNAVGEAWQEIEESLRSGRKRKYL